MTELVLEKMNWTLPQKAKMKMEVTDNQTVGMIMEVMRIISHLKVLGNSKYYFLHYRCEKSEVVVMCISLKNTGSGSEFRSDFPTSSLH